MKPSARSVVVPYVICLGALLSNLSAGMFNIALIDIAEDYHQSVRSAQWVVTVYLLAISVCLPFMGRLGDLRGKRSIHNFGYLLFAIGALCCALAPNFASLVGFRVIQGIGASMYQATNMALIVTVFPKEQKGRALGLIGAFVAAGSLIGPSLGGIVVQWFSWRANFGLLSVIAAASWILAQRVIPKDRPEEQANVDITGAFLFGLSLTGLVTALDMVKQWGWGSMPVLSLFALFVLCSVSFIVWCLSPRWKTSGKSPFIELELFTHSNTVIGILITIVTYMASFSTQLALPVFLRSFLHVQPATAGMIMMGYPLSLIVSSPLCGRFSDRIGAVPVLSVGLAVMTASLAALSFLSPSHGLLVVVLLIVVLGFSMGMINSPNSSIIMNQAPKSYLGAFSSVLALCRNLGMMLGTVAGGMLTNVPFNSRVQTVPGEVILNGYRALFVGLAILVMTACGLLILSARRTGRKEAMSEF